MLYSYTSYILEPIVMSEHSPYTSIPTNILYLNIFNRLENLFVKGDGVVINIEKRI